MKPTAATGGVSRSIIDGLQVSIEAILGGGQVTIGELNALQPGETLSLDARLADPVEIRLNGVAIATGELVAVGDNFAVRIATIAES